jgi:hypothetical protein
MPYLSFIDYEKGIPISQSKTGQADNRPPQAMGPKTKKEGCKTLRPAGLGRLFLCLLILLGFFLSISCSSKPKTSLLLRDPAEPPKIVQETYAREGKSDYFLYHDEGYSFRLIYLCENRVLNFIEEPSNNPILVSIQPILDTPVEKRLSPDDRIRVWACIERKVWEEQSRMEESKIRLVRERIQLEREIQKTLAEKEKITAEIEEKKRLDAERQRRLELERRRAEEERQKKSAEEARKVSGEDQRIKFYKSGEKEGLLLPPPPPPLSPKVTESGVFLVMKEAAIYEEPIEKSKVISRGDKYDLFDVIQSKKDESGNYWHQVRVGERIISDKGKKYGWSPEERSFWVKNKLLVWVYPGDFANIANAKAVKMRPEDVHFTSRIALTPQKLTYYEVTFGTDSTLREEIFGWVAENDGIRRSTKNKEEMRTLLKDLSKTLWPIPIQEDVLRGFIRQGFTREQVVLSWGRPDHVNTTRTLVGIHEQWVYGEPPFPKSYVYFENGMVKSWEFIRNTGK